MATERTRPFNPTSYIITGLWDPYPDNLDPNYVAPYDVTGVWKFDFYNNFVKKIATASRDIPKFALDVNPSEPAGLGHNSFAKISLGYGRAVNDPGEMDPVTLIQVDTYTQYLNLYLEVSSAPDGSTPWKDVSLGINYTTSNWDNTTDPDVFEYVSNNFTYVFVEEDWESEPAYTEEEYYALTPPRPNPWLDTDDNLFRTTFEDYIELVSTVTTQFTVNPNYPGPGEPEYLSDPPVYNGVYEPLLGQTFDAETVSTDYFYGE